MFPDLNDISQVVAFLFNTLSSLQLAKAYIFIRQVTKESALLQFSSLDLTATTVGEVDDFMETYTCRSCSYSDGHPVAPYVAKMPHNPKRPPQTPRTLISVPAGAASPLRRGWLAQIVPAHALLGGHQLHVPRDAPQRVPPPERLERRALLAARD